MAEIAALFRMKLAGLRRRLRPWEIPAAVRAINDEKQAALKAVRARRAGERLAERRASEQHGQRELLLRSRAPPQPR